MVPWFSSVFTDPSMAFNKRASYDRERCQLLHYPIALPRRCMVVKDPAWRLAWYGKVTHTAKSCLISFLDIYWEINCLILPRQADWTLPPQKNLSGLLGLAAKGKYCFIKGHRKTWDCLRSWKKLSHFCSLTYPSPICLMAFDDLGCW